MDEKAKQEQEKALLDLLSLIRGDRWMGARGLRTYPDDADEGQRRLHQGCVALEERGLIERFKDDPDVVIWMPKEEHKTK